MQLKGYLEQNGFTENYPSNLQIVGGNFDPGPMRQAIATLASYLWLAGLGFAFFGHIIFNFLGMKDPERLPAWYNYLQKNKTACLIGLFVLNNMGNSQLATGAFEIILDGELIYSKLGNGNVPKPETLAALLLEKGMKQGTNMML
jgi:selT/selW/selH-like putative selenoprotein|tara:strand:- start:226 stop:660 length:435 start_codon:yes stop_codon:yes gene_type:complete